MADIAELGIAVRSDDVPRATRHLQDFERQAGRTESATSRLARQVNGLLRLAAVTYVFKQIGDAIGSAIGRVDKMEKMSRQLDRALLNTGNTARTSAAEVKAFAEQLEESTGRASEEIMAVSTNLATFGFGREQFFRAIKLADDMAAAWGGDLRQNVEGLARALAEPEKGLAMLTKRGITFTPVQQEMIDKFMRLNDLAGAQGVIFEALEAQVKGVAEEGFGGLQAAWSRASDAWDDAFDDLVQGEEAAGGLKGTLEELMETISSPEFINAVMSFGQAIITVIDAIAKMAIGAWNAFNAFLDLVNKPGGAMDKWNSANMPLADRDTERLQRDLTQKQELLTHGDYSFPFNTSGISDRPKLEREIAEIKTILTGRPANWGTYDDSGGALPSHGDMLKQFSSPGSANLNDPLFDPYEGGGAGSGADAREKMRKAYEELTRGAREFIEEQKLEAGALGMTEERANALRYEQELLNDAANDNITLTAAQRAELAGYAEQMAAAEESTRRLTEIYEFGKDTFNSFFRDLKSGLTDGTVGWDDLGNAAVKAMDRIADRALSMAADQAFDMIFKAVMGGIGAGLGGGSSIGLGAGSIFGSGAGSWSKFSWDGGGFTGDGARSGGMDGKEGFPAMLHPRETVIDHTRSANLNMAGPANSNQRVEIEVFVRDDGTLGAIARQAGRQGGAEAAVVHVREFDKALPDRMAAIAADPRAR